MDNFMKKAVPVMAKAGEYIFTYLAFIALAAAPLTYMGRMLQKDAPVTVRVAGVIAAVILCAAFFSLVRGYIMFDEKLRSLYAALPVASSRFFEKCAFFLRRPAFWIETAAVAALFWILPLVAFSPDGEMLTLPSKWMIFSVLFPLFFSLNLAARLSAARWWKRTVCAGRPFDYSDKARGKQLAIIAVVYGAAGIVLPMGIQALVGILLGGGYVAFLILKSIWPIVLILLFIVYFRAWRKRRVFLRELRKICREKGYELSPVHRPYLSVIRFPEGESFSVQTPKGRYSCKLIGSVRRLVPMILQPNGEGCFVHALKIRGYEMLRYESVFTFGYPSEDKKMLIISPVPKKVILCDRGRMHVMDNGDYAGDFRMYTVTAFLNALERECLDK